MNKTVVAEILPSRQVTHLEQKSVLPVLANLLSADVQVLVPRVSGCGVHEIFP